MITFLVEGYNVSQMYLYPAIRAVSATLMHGAVGFFGSALWMASGGIFGFMMLGLIGCSGSFFAIEL